MRAVRHPYALPVPSPEVELSEWYAWFADHEAAGRSPLYEEFARGVAADAGVLKSLCELPPAKRQPNLLLGAVRHVCGLAADWPAFRDSYHRHREQVHAVMRERRTQTNEPARCSILLPVLAQLPQPLALIEVGAAAGLCLLIDRYRYDYGRGEIPAIDGSSETPLFTCQVNERVPVPVHPLEVAWRAGLDLNPLDVNKPDDVAWLQTLVWPGEGRRAELLAQAVEVARRDPPRVVRGDLRHDLTSLVREAPADATRVVFNYSVLPYVEDPAERTRFGEQVLSLGARWIASEGVDVIAPGDTARNDSDLAGQALLALDGEPVARADMHGTWLHWL
jgi:hypothetical protein